MDIDRYPALVLNADYTPVSQFPLSLWDMTRTLKNVIKDTVIVVERYDVKLRSPSFEYQPPSVVALKRYVRRPKTVPFTRFNVYLRDRFRCQYCGERFPVSELTFDHVVPRSRGGESVFTNIVAACVPCNHKKGDRTDIKPLRKPYQPTQFELARVKRDLPANYLHDSWMDYLYWDADLVR